MAYAVASPDVLIVAIAVDGVDGPTLVGALVRTWPPGGNAVAATVGEKQVLRLDGASDVYFYNRGASAYVVETAQPLLADEVFRGLP